jgi:hypothetical protein
MKVSIFHALQTVKSYARKRKFVLPLKSVIGLLCTFKLDIVASLYHYLFFTDKFQPKIFLLLDKLYHRHPQPGFLDYFHLYF